MKPILVNAPIFISPKNTKKYLVFYIIREYKIEKLATNGLRFAIKESFACVLKISYFEDW